MALKLPTFQMRSADFQYSVELQGEGLATFRFKYNVRNGSFQLDFTDPSRGRLLSIKVVPRWLLFRQFKGRIDLRGDILVQPIDDQVGEVITYSNFGNGMALYYVTPAEASDWRIENGI